MLFTGVDKGGERQRVPLSDAALSWPPPVWQAAWIWTRELTEGNNDYVCFRREFDLMDLTGRILLRVAAQRDAALWVNGQLIDYGPPVSDPRFQRYQTHDVSRFLRSGRNCIAVRVFHDTARGALTAQVKARGLLCQLEQDGEVLISSDENWRSRRSRAYLDSTVGFGDTLWPEIFNAGEDTPGWTEVGFDDRLWPQSAPVIPPVHDLWSAAQPQARFFPWVNLVPSETRPLCRERLHPAAIIAVGEIRQEREATPHDTATRMSLEPLRQLEKATVINVSSLLTGNGEATVINSSPDEDHASFDGLRNAVIVLDFGRLINARFGLRMTARGGCIDIGYDYTGRDNRVIPYRSCRTAMADHYIARTGGQEWETADWRHFRYVQLTFRNLVEPLILHEVWAEAVSGHFTARGRFAGSDPVLEAVFDMVRRTADLNVVDRAMDNPSRERRQYLGDCSSIVPAVAFCFGDTAVVHRYFYNAVEGQHPTGLFRYSYPGHDDDRASLFDHSLALPLRLREYYRWFADKKLVRSLWPACERFLNLVASCLDGNYRMQLPPYCIWFDWGHLDRRGFFLPLQAMSGAVFRAAAELAEFIGVRADQWAELATRMTARITDWFDPQRGVFVDSIVDGRRQQHYSEHANSLIAYWELAPDAMIQSCFDRWSANPDDFGRASPAWHYLPAAFVRAGRPELAIRWLHERHSQISDQGLDTWPETWCLYGEKTTGSWRPRNSRAVAQGAGLGGIPVALIEGICGIQPAVPGFAAVRIVPQPGPLTSFSGTFPGPDGDYTMQGQDKEASWFLRLDLPSPRKVVFDAVVAPEAREIIVDGHIKAAVETLVMPGGKRVGRFEWQAGKKSLIEVLK